MGSVKPPRRNSLLRRWRSSRISVLSHSDPSYSEHGDVVVLAKAYGGVGDVFGSGPLLHEVVQALEALEFPLVVAGLTRPSLSTQLL